MGTRLHTGVQGCAPGHRQGGHQGGLATSQSRDCEYRQEGQFRTRCVGAPWFGLGRRVGCQCVGWGERGVGRRVTTESSPGGPARMEMGRERGATAAAPLDPPAVVPVRGHPSPCPQDVKGSLPPPHSPYALIRSLQAPPPSTPSAGSADKGEDAKKRKLNWHSGGCSGGGEAP